MFVVVDQEVGAAFGPFSSNEEAVLWVHLRLIETQVIDLDDEAEAVIQGRESIEAIQEDLMSMSWFIYEVEHVEVEPNWLELEQPEPASHLTEMEFLPDTDEELVYLDGKVITRVVSRRLRRKETIQA
jgi:hypothetical protein